MNTVPVSMRDELQTWNRGKGIDLQGWIACNGSFALAVGYASIFCPEFIEFNDYILTHRKVTPDAVRTIREFEKREGATPCAIERELNHFHLADIQYYGCPDLPADKLLFIGSTLKRAYEARLTYSFPQRPCIVEFHIPENPEKLYDYQISFWQTKNT
jgi:hypothetical protein